MQPVRTLSILGLALAASLILGACQVLFPSFAFATIGDFTWVDDGDGIYETDEPPLADVAVRLHSVDKGELVGETVTDADGTYAFHDVEPGEYFLEFEPPGDFVFTPKDQGDDDTLDSDADPNTHRTDNFRVAEGEQALQWDAGFLPPEALATPTPKPIPTATPTPTPTPIPLPNFDDPLDDTLNCAAGTVDIDPASDIVRVTWEWLPDGSVRIRVYIAAPPDDPTQTEYSYAVVVTFNPGAGDNPRLVWEWHDGKPFVQGDASWGMLPGAAGPPVPGPTFRVPADQLPEIIESVLVSSYHMADAAGTWWCDEAQFQPPSGP